MNFGRLPYYGIKNEIIANEEKGRKDLFQYFVERNNVLLWRDYWPNTKVPPPYCDHGRSYRILYNGVRRQIDVFHEEVDFERVHWDDICKETYEWAAAHNKVAEIYDGSHSWYNYDENGLGTALIIIHDPDVEVTVL